MRFVVLSVLLIGFTVCASGCGSNTVEIPRDTVAWDSARDGAPMGVGGNTGRAPMQKGSNRSTQSK